MATQGRTDSRQVSTGRPNDEQRGLVVFAPPAPSGTGPLEVGRSVLGAAEAGVKVGSKVIGGPAFELMKMVFSEAKLFALLVEVGWSVATSIKRIVDQPYDLGYGEGYARTLSRAAFGRPFEELGYRSKSYGFFATEVDLRKLQSQLDGTDRRTKYGQLTAVDIKMALDYGKGFFQGKREAMEQLSRQSSITEKQLLNDLNRNVATSKGHSASLLYQLEP